MAASKLSEHWQVGKSLTECNLHMLEHNFSDVIFKLDYKQAQEKQKPVYVRALRLLLAARSPVFYAMFFGEHAKQETENPVIDIYDIEPSAFKEMIRFIYADEIQLTDDNVLGVLYASKKYIVTTLATRCIQFLEEKLSVETAAPLLEQSMLYDEDDLKAKALRKIEHEASAVLRSDDFKNLSAEALKEVLQLNLKIAKELDVFKASMRWAENKCRKLNKSCDGENMREILGENLFLLRFPTMSIDEFNETVLPSEVLSSQEVIQISRYMTSKSNKSANLPFPTQARVDAAPRPLWLSAPRFTNLHQSENPWVPTRKRKTDADEATRATEAIYKALTAILNKLTPQKFSTLVHQVLKLDINTEERLKGTVDIIFEKAVNEPYFSVAYANMAKCMVSLKVPSPANPNEVVRFQKLLLNRCQKEFERDKASDKDMEQRLREIEEATSEDTKRRLREEMQLKSYNDKRRSLGNIRFIGELFKLKMLTEKTMQDCIVRLINSNDEENLECVCILMSTIGKDIDRPDPKSKQRVDAYFVQLDKIVKVKATSSRVRFLIQDLMGLRLNKWVPRQEEGPKTIDAIHKEAQQEEVERHGHPEVGDQ